MNTGHKTKVKKKQVKTTYNKIKTGSVVSHITYYATDCVYHYYSGAPSNNVSFCFTV